MILSTEQEYQNFAGVNQSRLKLIENPSLFQNLKIEDKDEGEAEHFKFGTYIDDLLLGIDIDSKYLTTDLKKLPPDEIKKVLDRFVEANNPTLDIDTYKDQLVSACKLAGVYATYKDDTIFNKVKNYEEYFEFLKSRGDKIILTSEQSSLGLYYKNLLESDPLYSKYYISKDNIEIKKKVRIGLDFNHRSLPHFPNGSIISIKGELDTLMIDHEAKTYSVVDDKTTSDLFNFQSSIFKYRYDFQLAFYNLLVYYSREELEIKDYLPTQSKLIAISSKFPQPPLIYKVDHNKVARGYKRGGRYYIGIYEAMERYMQHRDSGIWNTPIEMMRDGFINLNFE